jgi:hypothetical protein
MHPITFIVSAGRSGSTLLSRILGRHPDVLCLDELFASIQQLDPDKEVRGPEFWSALVEPDLVFNALIRSGVTVPEFGYTRLPETRFGADRGGVPAIGLMTLPHLTERPDDLLDQLAAEVPLWPTRPAREHYRELISWFSARFGGTAVVERSGYSLDSVQWMRSCFPEARFVHLHRKGADAALSMSRHPLFRQLGVLQEMLHRNPKFTEMILQAVARSGGHDRDEPAGFATFSLLRQVTAALGLDSPEGLLGMFAALIPEDIAPLLASEFDPALLMDRGMDLSLFAELWSETVQRGTGLLAAVPGGRRTQLSYEDLLAEPEATLTSLAGFLGVAPGPDWLREGSAMLEPGRAGAAERLAPADFEALVRGCETGERSLRGEAASLPS